MSDSRLTLDLLFLLGVLLLLLAAVTGLRRGWRRRHAGPADDLPDLLSPPADAGVALAAPLKGSYLGTVDAGHWHDRITTRGLGGKADGYIGVYEGGVRLDRAGEEPFWVPREAVRGARLERALAGKVVGPGRIVVVAWSFGGRELETGFRGEDRPRQPKIVRAVHELLGPAPASIVDGEATRPQPIVRAFPRLRRHHTPVAPPGPPVVPRAARHPGAPATDPTPLPVAAPVHPAPRPVPAEPGAYVDPLTSPLGDVVRRMREMP